MSRRAAAWLAWLVCGLKLVLIACSVVLAFLNHGGVPVVSLSTLVTHPSQRPISGSGHQRRRPLGHYLVDQVERE
jgi:hypothetical protein